MDSPLEYRFSAYFNVADELWAEELTLEELDAEWVAEAKSAAEELSLPWPPDLPSAEEMSNDMHNKGIL